MAIGESCLPKLSGSMKKQALRICGDDTGDPCCRVEELKFNSTFGSHRRDMIFQILAVLRAGIIYMQDDEMMLVDILKLRDGVDTCC